MPYLQYQRTAQWAFAENAAFEWVHVLLRQQKKSKNFTTSIYLQQRQINSLSNNGI